MNKLVIPTILLATVMVAGMFAFMPVEQASTVHDTVRSNTLEIIDVATTPANFDITDDDELRITSDNPFNIIGINCVQVDSDNAEHILETQIVITNRPTATGTDAANNYDNVSADIPIVGGGQITFQLIDDADFGKYVANGGDFIVFDFGTLTDDGDADETIDCNVQVNSAADSTVTAQWVAV